jgi:hypothetical protein
VEEHTADGIGFIVVQVIELFHGQVADGTQDGAPHPGHHRKHGTNLRTESFAGTDHIGAVVGVEYYWSNGV